MTNPRSAIAAGRGLKYFKQAQNFVLSVLVNKIIIKVSLILVEGLRFA